MQVTLPPVGVLRPGECLTLRAFKDRLSLTDSAVRSMRRDGLPVRRIGKRHFVLADDFTRYVQERSMVVA